VQKVPVKVEKASNFFGDWRGCSLPLSGQVLLLCKLQMYKPQILLDYIQNQVNKFTSQSGLKAFEHEKIVQMSLVKR
jgi:hypothetical protein